MTGRFIVWLVIALATLSLVLFALGHAVVVFLVGLGAVGYALWRRKVGA